MGIIKLLLDYKFLSSLSVYQAVNHASDRIGSCRGMRALPPGGKFDIKTPLARIYKIFQRADYTV